MPLTASTLDAGAATPTSLNKRHHLQTAIRTAVDARTAAAAMRNATPNGSLPPVQPRFVRQPNASSKTARFTSRSRFLAPAFLQSLFDAMLTAFRVPRTRRARFLFARLGLASLVACVILYSTRNAQPSLIGLSARLQSPFHDEGAASVDHDIDPDADKADDSDIHPADDLAAGRNGAEAASEGAASEGAANNGAASEGAESEETAGEGETGDIGEGEEQNIDNKQAELQEVEDSSHVPHNAPAPVDVVDGAPSKPNDAPGDETATRTADDEVSPPVRTVGLREKHTTGNLSVVVLFHNEFESLNIALASWINNRLIDYVDEILFFLNGVESEKAFLQKVPDFQTKIPAAKRRIALSRENLPLGHAVTKMVEMARSEYVLLMEKDWELIESEAVMKSRLDDSKVLLSTGVANLVRHRHRHNPGVPLHALIMHVGREESILRIQKNLLCYTHHWQRDPTVSYPASGIMHRCGGPTFGLVEEDVFCAPSEFCQWTNNPGLFKRDWFMNEVGLEYLRQYRIEKDKEGPSSPFLDFEYYTNWRSFAWADKNFTIAVGTGLFRHAETEQTYFNKLWYAHYRVTVDMEELRKFYLMNETSFKKLGGVHYDPGAPKPPTMLERYPVDFVRKYMWPRTFTGTLESQREMINSIYQSYVRLYRMDPADWATPGAAIPAKARKCVDWRMEITKLSTIVERAMMLVPPEQPHEMSITLVTCLLDLDRHSLQNDAYQFRRDFQMYVDAMKTWLTHKYKKVVYTTREIANEVMNGASEEVRQSTKFVFTTREELRTRWIGPDNYEAIQTIRQSDQWRRQASWLPNSPQGGLQDYNPLVMSKMFMMRDAARQNLWNTTHFLFLDSKHNCMSPDVMTPKNDHIIRAHMFNKLLMTTFDYTPQDEVHGFAYKAFNEYLNIESPGDRTLLRVGRGGIFGGSAFVLEYIAAMYDIALTGSLREGLMGTEECIFSILLYNVRQYVDEFSNNWACPDKLDGDHKCDGIPSQGYNCAIIEWAKRDAVEWDAPAQAGVSANGGVPRDPDNATVGHKSLSSPVTGEEQSAR